MKKAIRLYLIIEGIFYALLFVLVSFDINFLDEYASYGVVGFAVVGVTLLGGLVFGRIFFREYREGFISNLLLTLVGLLAPLIGIAILMSQLH